MYIKCKLKISFAEQAVHTLIYLKMFSSQVEFSKQATYSYIHVDVLRIHVNKLSLLINLNIVGTANQELIAKSVDM